MLNGRALVVGTMMLAWAVAASGCASKTSLGKDRRDASLETAVLADAVVDLVEGGVEAVRSDATTVGPSDLPAQDAARETDAQLSDSASDLALTPGRDAVAGEPEIASDLGQETPDAETTAGNLAITPGTSPVDLGQMNKGATGVTTYLTVTNLGSSATRSLVVSTTDPQVILVDDRCTGAPLARSASCTLGVAGRPTQTGVIDGTVTVSDGASAQTSIAVRCIGLPYYLLAASPPSFYFGAFWIGTVSPAQTFTVVNTGNQSSGSLAMPWNHSQLLISNDTCSGAALGPGDRCTFDITYDPGGCQIMVVETNLVVTPKIGSPLSIQLQAACDY